jgi:hypothetical protein
MKEKVKKNSIKEWREANESNKRPSANEKKDRKD